MKRLLIALTFIIGAFAACKKEEAATPASTARKLFQPCECQPSGGKEEDAEYIKAELDGVSICFDVKPNLGDTFPNMLKYGYILRDAGDQYYDNLHMIRDDRHSEWQAAMFFENTHAFTKTYPYNLPRPDPEVCEIGGLQINNRYAPRRCYECPENDAHFSAQFFGNGVRMTVTSFTGNVFEGVFSGTVRNGTGRSVAVTNDKFRIKLVVYRSDIRLR